MQREYRGFIFTKHALERAERRQISQDEVVQVIQQPTQTIPGEKANSVKFIRELDGRLIHVVATLLAPQKQWLVVSVWVRGEEDPVPMSWQMLSWPFRVAWWLIMKAWQALAHLLRRQ